MEFLDFGTDHLAVFLGERDVHAVAQGAAVDAPDSDTADVGVVVEAGDEHLRGALQFFGGGDVLDDGVHEGGQVGGRLAPVGGHPAVLCRTVDSLEIQLVVGSIEVEHQVEHLLLYLVRTAVEFVHLVDNHDGFEVEFQCLLQHEACLRHRPLEGVHEQQHAVRHIEYALHLAAEIGVPGSVYDVDFVAFILDSDVFGKDSDASLALQVVVIQYQLAFLFVVAKQVGSVQHLVNQGGFAVVNVGDNRYVSNLLHTCVVTQSEL